MVNTLCHLARVVALFILAGYLLLLVHIPVFEFMSEPTIILGGWLTLAVGVLIGAGWLLYAFSWVRLGTWLVLLLLLHGAVWLVGGVQIAFIKDSCWDKGGAWKEGVCSFKEE